VPSPFGSEPIAAVIAEATVPAFRRALARAEKAARVVELRLDALGRPDAIVRLLESLPRRSRLIRIATCRGRRAGGSFVGSPSLQLALLRLAARAGCDWVDVEAGSLEAFPPSLRRALLRGLRSIVSFHDFRRTPADLARLYRRVARLGGHIVKIAVNASRQRDNLAVLRLARRHRGKVIALAMGTCGIPSRVLGVRAGSALTYATLNGRPAVAPGQLPLTQLRQLYRAHRLDRRTRLYGVIGYPIAHSLSPTMQNVAFQAARLNAVYLPFEARSLGDFLALCAELGVAGFSVTLPHKQAILRHLDGCDPVAVSIGAVNTVVVRGGRRLYGYNTDYVGVLRTLARYLPLQGAQVLIVGAGGAARAVAFALATAGSFVSITARRPAQARALARAVGGEVLPQRQLTHRRFHAIVNCTPVGQVPEVETSPLAARELNARVVFDLVYNPLETRLLRLARRRGAIAVPGWQMLVEQGAAQFEIWTGLRAPLAAMRRAVRRALRSQNEHGFG
ncbi:MAG: shikimate dehydrogenase, partial [Acidobacteria bacterium]|nr:shikimate dehydrogenase [Acidobacteriota bacterium]